VMIASEHRAKVPNLLRRALLRAEVAGLDISRVRGVEDGDDGGIVEGAGVGRAGRRCPKLGGACREAERNRAEHGRERRWDNEGLSHGTSKVVVGPSPVTVTAKPAEVRDTNVI